MIREITDAEVEAVATAMARLTRTGDDKDGYPIYEQTLGAITIDADGLRQEARRLLGIAAKEEGDNPGARMYNPSFACEDEGHRGVRLKGGSPYCLDCDKLWTHIGEITS